MKMRIAALILLALLPVLAVTATYATKPTMGKGTVTLVHSDPVGSPRSAGDNTIATFKNTFSLTGTLKGTAIALERDVTHASGDKSFTTFQGEATFTSSTGDSATTGTLVIHYVGINDAGSIHGQFVANSGTGSLADFHGQGDFSGKANMPLNYTIDSHIDPQPQTKTAH